MMWFMRGKIAIGWGNWGRLCEEDFNLTDWVPLWYKGQGECLDSENQPVVLESR